MRKPKANTLASLLVGGKLTDTGKVAAYAAPATETSLSDEHVQVVEKVCDELYGFVASTVNVGQRGSFLPRTELADAVITAFEQGRTFAELAGSDGKPSIFPSSLFGKARRYLNGTAIVTDQDAANHVKAHGAEPGFKALTVTDETSACGYIERTYNGSKKVSRGTEGVEIKGTKPAKTGKGSK